MVSTALCGTDSCGIRTAAGRKMNVLEMKCLRSLVEVSRMDRVRGMGFVEEMVQKGSGRVEWTKSNVNTWTL